MFGTLYGTALGILGRSGVASLLERRTFGSGRFPHIRALGYHGTPPRARDSLRRQFSWLRERYRSVDEAGLAALLGGNRAEDRPGVVLSFDDGLADNYRVAAPLLEEFGFRGWFFVTGTLPGLDAEAGRRFCAEATIYADPGNRDRPGMDWDELRDLVGRGHIVGCHTMRHTRFHGGIDPGTLRDELAGATDAILRETGTRPSAFAWVGGETPAVYAREGLRALRETGFRFAFTTKSRPVRPGDDPLILHRTIVDADLDLDVFRMKVLGVSDLAHRRARAAIESSFAREPDR